VRRGLDCRARFDPGGGGILLLQNIERVVTG